MIGPPLPPPILIGRLGGLIEFPEAEFDGLSFMPVPPLKAGFQLFRGIPYSLKQFRVRTLSDYPAGIQNNNLIGIHDCAHALRTIKTVASDVYSRNAFRRAASVLKSNAEKLSSNI